LLTGYLDMAAEGQAEFGQPACQFFDPLWRRRPQGSTQDELA